MKIALFLLRQAARLLGLARRHPLPFALAAALVFAWWQWTGRISALAARDQARTALATERKGRAADAAAWRQQVTTARAATAAAERKSKEIASDAQTSHDTLAADNAGLRAYIAARSLRPGSGAALAARPADDLGSTLPAGVPTGALVAADAADLATCDGLYVYAASAHRWAQGLIAGGLAQGTAK